MKKMINYAFIYGIASMVMGVFYREFTKFNGFEGVTSLGKVHGHLLLLGTFFFLILGLYMDRIKGSEQRGFNKAFTIYNVGLIWMVVMMIVRGIVEVVNVSLSTGYSAAISGLAGLGHMLLGVGIVYIFIVLRKSV